MVEIINKTDVQYVYYPKTQNSTGPYTLHIHSELSQKDWHFENVEDKASLHDYYKFLVDYSNVDDGEFNYFILENEEVMDTGLLRIGIGQASVRGYDTPNEIIQYDMYGAPTERYQHKSISATSNGTYNVLPDEDYVALSEVDVYVNVPSDSGASYESGYTKGYESGYTQGSEDGYGSGYTKGTADGFGSGYTSGKTDGAAEQKAKLVATAVTSNGTYSRPDGYSSIQVSIPQTGHTDEEMQQAYASGQTYQKSLLVSTAVTSNGTYSRPDGYSSFVVSVPSDSGTGYNSGYTDGYNSGYTEGTADGYGSGYTSGKTDGYNSGYTEGSEDGYGSGYTSGKTDGIAEQKAKLVATAFTQNGTYARNDGWNSVVIDVSGYTEQDLLDAFNSGYTNGYNSGNTDGYASGWTDGYNSGWTDGYASGQTPSSAATAITVNAPSAITGTGKVTVTVEPSTAIVDLVYVSSDDTIARVDSNGNITVLSAGTISITVTDRNSGIYGYAIINVEPASGLDVPFTVDVVSGGTIVFSANETATPLTIQFKLNDGSWANITSSTAGTPIAVVSGDIVQFRGDNATYKGNSLQMQSGRYSLRGNIMSLVNSANYPTLTSYGPGHSEVFSEFFSGSYGILTAKDLLIPATDAPESAYYKMFYGCRSMGAAPSLLPATTLSANCYDHMFTACQGLTQIPAILPATTLADGCYNYMFANCLSLSRAPELPATTLAANCYKGMFNTCGNLTGVTSNYLPATTLADYCYQYMFGSCLRFVSAPSLPATGLAQGCYSYMFSQDGITTAPELPATTMADNCYEHMFDSCTSLTGAPSLPATTLASNCYNGMFSGCTSLQTGPALPATSLATGCYEGMFAGCRRFETGPSLPATSLANRCYYQMFASCTGMTRAPELPALTLTTDAYREMFKGCTKLAYIKCIATDISASNCTLNWVGGVASSGTFVKNASMTGWTTGNNGIPTGWIVVDYNGYLLEPLTFNIISAGTINWHAADSSETRTIQYSKNNGEWASITSNTGASAPSISVRDGDVVQFRGDNATYCSSYGNYNSFGGSTAKFEVEGNIMSLINSTGFETATTLASSYTFYYLFGNCTGLISAENLVLPATTLTERCYEAMFQTCASLTTAPELPATTLAQSCYYNMFLGCRSLTTAPSILPATTLASWCYANMFQSCISLTTAPVLPATTLAQACYSVMFAGCTSLSYIKCLATDISASDCTNYWVGDVASSGTFVKNASMTGWTTGNDGIPTGWTVQDAQ